MSREGFHSAGLLLEIFADYLRLVGDRLLFSAGKMERLCVKNARRTLEDSYRQKVLLPEIARKVGLSPEYLSRLFHRETGRTITRYLMELRVAEFKRLLLLPERNVTFAIFDSGFQSVSQGNRAFRDICGMSPKEFRIRMLHLTPGQRRSKSAQFLSIGG